MIKNGLDTFLSCLHTSFNTGTAHHKRLVTGFKATINSCFHCVFALSLFSLLHWVNLLLIPSFINELPIETQTAVFLRSLSLTFTLAVAIFTLSFIGSATLRITTKAAPFSDTIILLPACLYAVLLFLVIENFIAAVVGTRIIHTSGPTILLYTILFVSLLLAAYHELKIHQTKEDILPKLRYLIYLTYLALVFCIPLSSGATKIAGAEFDNAKPTEMPDIFLLSADGVHADHISAYGYDRDTTPFLRRLSADSLIFNNAFANSNNTGGSLSALWTSRLATETGLLQFPAILPTSQSQQHLLALLANYGYSIFEHTQRKFADSSDLNFQWRGPPSNRRIPRPSTILGWPWQQGTPESYLLDSAYDTAIWKLAFVLGLANSRDIRWQMANVNSPYGEEDESGLNDLIEFIRGNNKPLYGHIHFLSSHGPTFRDDIGVFSAGLAQDQPKIPEFYDDTILFFDRLVEKFVKFLEEDRRLDRTILIIFSDHDLHHTLNQRIPLIIRTPGARYTGAISANVSLLDLAPTILALLGTTKPSWMRGRSLIEGNLDPWEPIVTMAPVDHPNHRRSPPLYEFQQVGIVRCSREARMMLTTGEVLFDRISSNSAPCLTERASHELDELIRSDLSFYAKKISETSWRQNQEIPD